MKIFLAVLLALYPCTSFAKTYLCVAEAGAIVEDGANRPASSVLADVSDSKYIVTKENDEWGVKELGIDFALFDQCIENSQGEPTLCERAGGFAGTFLMSEGAFSVLWMTRHNDRNQWVVAKGRCSTI